MRFCFLVVDQLYRGFESIGSRYCDFPLAAAFRTPWLLISLELLGIVMVKSFLIDLLVKDIYSSSRLCTYISSLLLSLLVMLGNHQHWQSSIDNPMNPMKFGWGGTASNFLISVAPKCPSLSGRVCVSDVPELPMIFEDFFEDRMEDGHEWKYLKKQGQVSACWTYHSTTDFHSPRAWASDFRNHVIGAGTKKTRQDSPLKIPGPNFRRAWQCAKNPAALGTRYQCQPVFFLLVFSSRCYPSKKWPPYFTSSTFWGCKEKLRFGELKQKSHQAALWWGVFGPWFFPGPKPAPMIGQVGVGRPKLWKGCCPKCWWRCGPIFFFGGVTSTWFVGIGPELCREIVGISSPCWRNLCDFNSF